MPVKSSHSNGTPIFFLRFMYLSHVKITTIWREDVRCVGVTIASTAKILRPESSCCHRTRPDPSRKRHALSPAEGKPQLLLFPPGKRDPAYLSGGFSSMYSWCPSVGLFLSHAMP
ncbi:hypothetical protein AVEN_106341-1 [Araneus ventricosus]|uniref:Uncharacterized protein n=1 Tax=Araneus ventricosus TaxID=182803 RepID=A0A4Y2ASG8_ARAVE|nr:hypothetical protein AVEN_106341-1 [Araneus ventricosus]